jgi:hypothetical protein
MNTSPREARTVAKTVSVDKEQEIETRLALHEFCHDRIQLYERKIERILEYMADLRSPEVDFATLMRNSLLDEDKLRWLEDDYDLFTMAYPEWNRPAWVKRFKGRQ